MKVDKLVIMKVCMANVLIVITPYYKDTVEKGYFLIEHTIFETNETIQQSMHHSTIIPFIRKWGSIKREALPEIKMFLEEYTNGQ